MTIIKKDSLEYKNFKTKTKKLGIMCDGSAHIIAIKILSNGNLSDLTNNWNTIVEKKPRLFDSYKGLDADKELLDIKKFEKDINVVFLPLNIHSKFYVINSKTEFKNILLNIFLNNKVANLTVIILDEKPSGHVITIWRIKNIIYLHDINLNTILNISIESLMAIYLDKYELDKGYRITYDKRFPIEAIDLNII